MFVDVAATESISIAQCCKVIELASSTYYGAKNRAPSETAKRREMIKKNIVEVYQKSKATYGSPRIHQSLVKRDINCSKTTVAKIMRENSIKARRKRAFKPMTTLSNHQHPIAKRIFDNDHVKAKSPNTVWASDITFIPVNDGWVYLNVTMDICTRKIIGWEISDHMLAELVDESLNKALRFGKCKIHHSDQGVQYASKKVRGKLKLLGITQSMSRRGNCYDNCFVESFFKTLKTELPKLKFSSLTEAKQTIFEYIEGWYNTQRLHSSLDYMSPIEYEQSLLVS